MFLKKFNKICGYIAGALVLIAALVIIYDVISRYAFNAPSLYAPYISAFLILGSAFIGTAYAMQSGGHVYVEIFVDKLKPLPRKICFTIGYVMSLVFVGALTRACWQFSLKAVDAGWRAQGNLPIPSVILYGIMTFGAAVLFITIIYKMIQMWRGKEEEES
ncbi:MAG: TRAP transporter small permease [Clostridiales Family XIII bacterium]|jgi:TRAP-type C4-dicarboxylate transport system permease small subunit|nr:TRAP transporter small permease [Clostridiales Family XIII bacterium]